MLESSNTKTSASAESSVSVVSCLGIGASKLDVFKHAFAGYGGMWEYINQQWVNKSERLVIQTCSGFDSLAGLTKSVACIPERDAYLLVRVSKNKRTVQVLRRFLLRNNIVVDTDF